MKKAGLLLFLAISWGHNSVAAEAGTPFKTTFAVKTDSVLRAQLPAAILQRGYIIAGTNPNTPPTTFYLDDNRTLAGREIDLMSAIGQRLGVAIQWHDTGGFDNIIPGLKSGRYDVALSNIRATKKRLEQVDFISYFNTSRQGIISRKDANIAPFTDLLALCGKKVGAGVGTAQIERLQQTSALCTAQQQAPIEVAIFPDRPAGVQAVISGRIPLFFGPWEGLSWQIATLDALTISGQISVNEAPMSIALPKGSPLEDAIQAALNSLINDGTYQHILDHWLVGYGALPEAKRNEAVLVF